MIEHPVVVSLADYDIASIAAVRSEMPSTEGYVIFVGAGFGSLAHVTLGGARAIREADALIFGPNVDQTMPWQPEIGASSDTLLFSSGEQPDLDRIVSLVELGLCVVWLLSGDPLLDGGAGEYARYLKTHGVRIDMVPGLSKLALAITSAGIAPDSDLSVWRGPQNDSQDKPSSFISLIPELSSAGVLSKAQQRDLAADCPALVVADYGMSCQQSKETILSDLSDELSQVADRPAAVVIGPAAKRDPGVNWFESRTLFGWRVLVPRTRGLPGIVERRLEHHGAMPVQLPTLSVEPPRNPQPLERAIQGLVEGSYQWVIFNSSKTVWAITDFLEKLGLDARAFSGLRIAAAGSSTIEALRQWGIKPDLVCEAEQRSEALASEFPLYDDILDPIDRVFIPRADVAISTLSTSLNELGWQVDDAVAYRTVRAAPPPAPIREAIKAGDFDAVIFGSASTVRNMVGIAGKPHNATIVAAIGPATVAACEEAHLRVDVVAKEPSLPGLVDALADFSADRAEALLAQGKPVCKPSQGRVRRRSSSTAS